MRLPDAAGVARLCGQSALGSNGEVTESCFIPRPGERYLSVHWLEYLGAGPLQDQLIALRTYLAASPVQGERRPTRNGKIAVLRAGALHEESLDAVMVAIECRHVPRIAHATVQVTPEGVIVRPAAGANASDPHSGIYTLPQEAAHELAVQQFLVSRVVYAEVGRV